MMGEIQHVGSLGSGDDDDEFNEMSQTWQLSRPRAHDDDIDAPLQGASVTSHRAVIVKLNYVGPDRIDL